ncbi:hypothetical protein U3516DRAFT_732974 [Neocallimastix sp. 'constans']
MPPNQDVFPIDMQNFLHTSTYFINYNKENLETLYGDHEFKFAVIMFNIELMMLINHMIFKNSM